MISLLYIILILASILLIAAVLVQPGKADMISGMGGFGGQMSNILGVRQSRNFLQTLTISLAVGIAVLSISANMMVDAPKAGTRTSDDVLKGQKLQMPLQKQAPNPAVPTQGQ